MLVIAFLPDGLASLGRLVRLRLPVRPTSSRVRAPAAPVQPATSTGADR